MTGRRLFSTALVLMMSPTALAQNSAPSANEVSEARVYAEDGGKLPYRLLRPIDYDAKQKYPLVLFLHGAGERGDDNALQLLHGGRNFIEEGFRKRHPAFIAAPQCPADKKWVDVPWDAQSHKAPPEPSPTMKQVFGMLAALQKEFSIDPGRTYVVGLSMGGYGTWDVAQRRPEMVAAAVPICGGGDPEYAERMQAMPVWAFHGAADELVPPSRSRDMITALEAVGGRPIYTEYEGVQHDCWTRTFDNRLMWDWLFAQHK